MLTSASHCNFYLINGDVRSVVDVVLESGADEGIDPLVLVADRLGQVRVAALHIFHRNNEGARLGLHQLPGLLEVLQLVALLPFFEEILEQFLTGVADLVLDEVGVVGGSSGEVHF